MAQDTADTCAPRVTEGRATTSRTPWVGLTRATQPTHRASSRGGLNSEQEDSRRHAGLGVINLATPSTKVLQATNRKHCHDIGSGHGILDTITINRVQTTVDPLPGQNSSIPPPPHSERDEGAVLKPALWTHPGTASVALLVIGLPTLQPLSSAIEATLQTKQYK